MNDREAFEAWFDSSPIEENRIGIAWLTWQAALAHARQQSGELIVPQGDVVGISIQFADGHKEKAADVIEEVLRYRARQQSGDYVMVPREPTKEMVKAGNLELSTWERPQRHSDAAYYAMIAAAPAQQEPPQQDRLGRAREAWSAARKQFPGIGEKEFSTQQNADTEAPKQVGELSERAFAEWQEECRQTAEYYAKNRAYFPAAKQSAEPVAWMRISIHGYPVECSQMAVGAFPVYRAAPPAVQGEPVAWCGKYDENGNAVEQRIAAPPADDEAVRLLREARNWEIHPDLRDEIDAYLARVKPCQS